MLYSGNRPKILMRLPYPKSLSHLLKEHDRHLGLGLQRGNRVRERRWICRGRYRSRLNRWRKKPSCDCKGLVLTGLIDCLISWLIGCVRLIDWLIDWLIDPIWLTDISCIHCLTGWLICHLSLMDIITECKGLTVYACFWQRSRNQTTDVSALFAVVGAGKYLPNPLQSGQKKWSPVSSNHLSGVWIPAATTHGCEARNSDVDFAGGPR